VALGYAQGKGAEETTDPQEARAGHPAEEKKDSSLRELRSEWTRRLLLGGAGTEDTAVEKEEDKQRDKSAGGIE
jgi:hypothetical protein